MGRQSPVSAGDHTEAASAFDRRMVPAALVLLTVVLQTGCTSAITSASLREALRQTAVSLSTTDHASAPEPSEEGDRPASVAVVEDVIEEPVPSLEEAIDRAVTRLARSGGVDDATRMVLIQTLQATRPRDWPAVVDEFVVALEAGRQSAGDEGPVETPAPVEPSPAVETASPAALRFPAAAAALAAPEPAAAVAVSAARPIDGAALSIVPDVDPIEPPDPDGATAPAAPAPTGPIVRNACFASRVKAWGVVDRFPQAVFHPGQELLVYFELENLLVRQSAAGHTTGVDTAFRLVAPDESVVKEWTFAPLVETCHAARRDYFVRYFLTIPDDMPAGQYRLEFLVSDTLGGGSAEESLDLDVIPRR
jgi:hypothetical protein